MCFDAIGPEHKITALPGSVLLGKRNGYKWMLHTLWLHNGRAHIPISKHSQLLVYITSSP